MIINDEEAQQNEAAGRHQNAEFELVLPEQIVVAKSCKERRKEKARERRLQEKLRKDQTDPIPDGRRRRLGGGNKRNPNLKVEIVKKNGNVHSEYISKISGPSSYANIPQAIKKGDPELKRRSVMINVNLTNY